MTHLLDDVLLIGKTEAGKLMVHLSEIEIADIFERLKNEIEQSTGNTHTIRLHINSIEGTVRTDEKLIRTMVINLLTNAVKFSPGASYVDLYVTADYNKLAIGVKDYGIGIPEQDIKNLFEPFYRASNAADVEGTGLGLSIIKKALDLLRGYVDIKSVIGQGTEITIVIPLEHA
jgi:signal transduction histidine kinase